MNVRVATYGLLCIFTACSIPTNSPRTRDSGSTTPGAWSESGPATAANQPAAPALAAPSLAGPSLAAPSLAGPSLAGPSLATTLNGTGASAFQPQDENYAPAALFAKAHGDYMIAREAWRPDIQASLFSVANEEVNSEPGEFDLLHGKADIQRRMFVSDPDSVITLGAQFEERSYQFDSRAANGTHDETLYRGSISVNYGRFVNDDTLVELEFMPGVWSDFSGTLTRDDWQFYGKAMVTWRYNESLFFLAGVERSGLFRRMDAYPLAGLAWIPDPQWRLDVYLPRQIRLTHSPTTDASIYLSIDLDGNDYSIRAPDSTAREINVQEFTASIGAQYRLNAHFSFFGDIGTTMGGDYRFQSNAGDPNIYDGQIVAQPFGRVGFGFTF